MRSSYVSRGYGMLVEPLSAELLPRSANHGDSKWQAGTSTLAWYLLASRPTILRPKGKQETTLRSSLSPKSALAVVTDM